MAGFDRILEITESAVEIIRPTFCDLFGQREGPGRNPVRGRTLRLSGEGRAGAERSQPADPSGRTGRLPRSFGFGKTTAANLVPRFYDVSGGRVLLDGIDVRDIKLESLRSNIGIVSQDIFLFSATIRENISYGKSNAPLSEVEDAARVAHADEFILRYPEKYDTLVGERGMTLSGAKSSGLRLLGRS